MYRNLYRWFYRKVATCACSEYQAFLPPPLQRPGEEAIAQRRFDRVKRSAIISMVTSILIILPRIWTVWIYSSDKHYTFSKAVTDVLEAIGSFSIPSFLLQQLALLSMVAKVTSLENCSRRVQGSNIRRKTRSRHFHSKITGVQQWNQHSHTNIWVHMISQLWSFDPVEPPLAIATSAFCYYILHYGCRYVWYHNIGMWLICIRGVNYNSTCTCSQKVSSPQVCQDRPLVKCACAFEPTIA